MRGALDEADRALTVAVRYRTKGLDYGQWQSTDPPARRK